MALALSALEPGELILLTIAVVGLVPVLLGYKPEAKWFAVGYGCIVVGTLATNLEALAFNTAFNFLEHSVGLMGVGIAFAYATYHRRQRLLAQSDDEIESPEV
ncbi:hypothetical protein [Halopiger goleimassiliensis]|uniref:hypothetical protein n=1 Tax=Halopiger goleimassiliensis TaxID=1293048 RepID=UPI0006776C22|nr:hypothetical protein [Halopiger goleimassiliensis]